MNSEIDLDRIKQLETENAALVAENQSLMDECNRLEARNRLLVFSLVQTIAIILIIFFANLF
jgi:hypothetical protein